MVSVCYDGQIIVRQDSQTKEVISIKNGEQQEIHVNYNCEIIVTQGCDAVRTIIVDVQEKAKAAIKWCECASQVDADGKTWEYRLVPGDKIIVGNTFKYVIGMAIPVVVDGE